MARSTFIGGILKKKPRRAGLPTFQNRSGLPRADSYFSGPASLAKNAAPKTAERGASVRAWSCPATENVGRLIRVHPDSPISANSRLFLFRIVVGHDGE
jgi:hypothetical protein